MEEARIASTIAGARPYVDEVLVIDDGSLDETARRARVAGARVISLDKNQGYIAAVKRGFIEASGEILILLDGDGEFPADQIPELMDPILAGKADMVQGKRPSIPRPSERLINWLANLKAPVGDSGTGFRAIRRDLAVMLELDGVCICGVFSLEVVAHGGRIIEVPIRLQAVDKPRRIAYYHINQFFRLIPWLIWK